jgi:heme/copper-type cytochrome/quinol oxidase subunit 2
MTLLITWLTAATLLFQDAAEQRPDLTLNYIIIAVLLVIAVVLSVIVIRRRLRERDDEWDS